MAGGAAAAPAEAVRHVTGAARWVRPVAAGGVIVAVAVAVGLVLHRRATPPDRTAVPPNPPVVASPQVPPHILATLRLGGALTGGTPPVGLSLPIADCAAAGRTVEPVLSTLLVFDARLDSGVHAVLTLSPPAATPGAGATSVDVHTSLRFPNSSLPARDGTGTLVTDPGGGGVLTFSAVAAAAPMSRVDGRLTWTCSP